MSRVVKKMLQYDIKKYLANLVEFKRSKNAGFSQRALAKQLGFSTSTFNEILKGKRHLSKKSIAKIKTALESDPDLEDILKNTDGSFANFHLESDTMTATASNWYHLAVLELIIVENFKEDPLWISESLGITPVEAKQAVEDLLRIGELKRNHAGQLIPGHPHTIKIGDEISREILARNTRESLLKVSDVAAQIPVEERFNGLMIVALSKEEHEYLQMKSMEFFKECADYLSRSKFQKTDVHLLTLGFVPLTRSETINQKG